MLNVKSQAMNNMEYNHGTQKEKEQQAECFCACYGQKASSNPNLQTQDRKAQERCQEPLAERMGVTTILLKIRNIIRALEDSSNSLESLQEINAALDAVGDLKENLIRTGSIIEKSQYESSVPHSWKPQLTANNMQ